MWVIMCR